MATPPAHASEGSADRFRTLLEINNALISNLTRETLFHAVAQALRRVVPFDRTAIFLHEPERNVLKLFMLEAGLPSAYFVPGLEMVPEGSHVGWVFQHGRPLLRRDLERERQYPAEEWAYADGVRSYVIVPLVAHGTAIGVLAVASVRANRYSEADAAVLQEVANQVALAVENMKLYEETRREVARREEAEATLRAVAEGTASVTGVDFFASLVRHVAAALRVRYAFVTECVRTNRARTLAFWKGDGFGENFEYDLAGTPCEDVLRAEVKCHASDLRRLFPEDKDLDALGAESYWGIPMFDSSGRVVGHLAVLNDRPMADDPRGIAVLRIFAARAGTELKRLHAEQDLRAALYEVETLKNRLQAENVYLQEEIRQEHNFDEIVGRSPALLEVLRKVERVAPTDTTVLIWGETGTGKELIAHAIHERSSRRDRPLVKVNCGAISAGLVESELFGHVRGAFTGALERRVGRFELADGGTLFLDEVGELPLETQVKLLRVLQEQEFESVGSSQTRRVDVRIIAATGRDLDEAVRAGRFRSDLFYRLNVFLLRLPPLRERRADIPQLVTFFLDRFAKRTGKPIEGVSQGTMDLLIGYAWPGNIRELRNVIERGVVLCQGSILALDRDLLPVGAVEAGARAPAAPRDGMPRGSGGATAGQPAAAASLEEVERRHILAVLEQTRGVIEGPGGAARILNLHPNTLRSRMKRLGIKRLGHEMS